MRVALTKYGCPEVIIFPLVVLAAMIFSLPVGIIFLPGWALLAIEAILTLALIWTLSFFRDPHRVVSVDKNLLLSPADGRITDIETVDENNFIGGPALRIGIFLNIFDVHINRAPCNVKVEKVTYKKGRYKNAMNPDSSRVNESNDIALIRTDKPQHKLIVRQISGAIARRIVCRAKVDQELAGGEKFGMIKFGSRTELYLAASEEAQCLVKTGDKVKAGLSPLIRYSKCQD